MLKFHHLMNSLQQSYEEGINIIFIWHMRRLRQTMVWEFAHSCMLGSGRRELYHPALAPGSLNSPGMLCVVCLSGSSCCYCSFLCSLILGVLGRQRMDGVLSPLSCPKMAMPSDHWLCSRHSASFISCSYLTFSLKDVLIAQNCLYDRWINLL